MSEPDNCSVKRQLGSTSSKGLPVLLQRLSPRNATADNCCIYAKGLRLASHEPHEPTKDCTKREAATFSVSPLQCVVGCVIDCVVGRMRTSSPGPPLTPPRCLTTDALSCRQSSSSRLLCRAWIVVEKVPQQHCDPTNSLVSECLGHHKWGGEPLSQFHTKTKTQSMAQLKSSKGKEKGGGFGQGGEGERRMSTFIQVCCCLLSCCRQKRYKTGWMTDPVSRNSTQKPRYNSHPHSAHARLETPSCLNLMLSNSYQLSCVDT